MNSSVEIIGTDGMVRTMIDGQLVAIRHAAPEELRPSAAAPIAPVFRPQVQQVQVHPADAVLAGLNEQQCAAAMHREGVALLLGAPGSGKTATIVARIARLVLSGVPASAVLAMTFTKTAAKEMNDRLDQLGIRGCRVGTIHSVANQLLRDVSWVKALTLDEHDKMRWVVKKQLSAMRMSGAVPRAGVDFEMVRRFIAWAKLRGCGLVAGDPFHLNAQLDEQHAGLAQTMSTWVGMSPEQLTGVYWEVEKLREAQQLYSYDDMLSWAWQLLLVDPGVGERARSTWQWVIVDECQDSGPVQWDLAWMLAGLPSCIRNAGGWQCGDHRRANLLVGGDVSQSIFQFACGCPELMMRLHSLAGSETGVVIYRLPVNYRSVPEICRVSTQLVAGQSWHLIGEIKPVREALAGKAVSIEAWPTMESEAAAAVAALKEAALQPDGSVNFDNCAVLSRMSVGLHLVEIECIRQRIVYQKRAAGSFMESKEVKDVLAYLRVACGGDPDGRWAKHVVNVPFRYIGKAVLESCEAAAVEDGVSILDALMQAKLGYRQKDDLRRLFRLLGDLNELARTAETRAAQIAAGDAPAKDSDQPEAVHVDGPAGMIALMLRETQYLEELRREEGLSTMDESRAAVIGELQRIASQFLSPLRFLAYIDAVAQAVKDAKRAGLSAKEGAPGALVLSTIHRAKGLQWGHVRVVDLAEGRFPCSRADDQDEELRLLFVAVSRAADSCVISYVNAEKKSEYVGLLEHAISD